MGMVRMLKAAMLGLFLGFFFLFMTLLVQGCDYAERCVNLCKLQGMVVDSLTQDKDGNYVCRCITMEKYLKKREGR
jgi:hypothetical protein